MAESIGDNLIRRMAENKVGHVFGVVGDHVLTFFKQMEDSPIKVVSPCDEQGAGFACLGQGLNGGRSFRRGPGSILASPVAS